MIRYEYKSVFVKYLDEHYKEGWEPVPNVPVVVDDPGNFNHQYLQLRRAIGGSE